MGFGPRAREPERRQLGDEPAQHLGDLHAGHGRTHAVVHAVAELPVSLAVAGWVDHRRVRVHLGITVGRMRVGVDDVAGIQRPL